MKKEEQGEHRRRRKEQKGEDGRKMNRRSIEKQSMNGVASLHENPRS